MFQSECIISLETKVLNIEKECRGTESKVGFWCFHSLWKFKMPCHLLVIGSLCFYQVQSQYSHLLGDFKALYPSMCWQTLWRCCFSFSADLSNCIHAKTFAEHIINGQQTLFCRSLRLASHVRWPEAHWKSIVKRKTRNNWSENTDELKATIKASIKGWQCHKLTTSTPSRINAIICSKGPPSTECIRKLNIIQLDFSFSWAIRT